MCGITGFYSNNNVFSSNDLERMTSILAHRGPENQSIFLHNNAGLGHRRLKIIDLSDDANQPMVSQTKHSIIVFNGEIYNFKEIKQRYHIAPRTNSDTEILLEAFEKAGAKILDELNGMFAFAIYNKQDNTLFLARDRMGIKPLYYFWDGENFAFASELKALISAQYIKEKKEICYDAIAEYLHLGYIPEPKSIYKKIYKFPSGSYTQIKNGEIIFVTYWQLKDKLKPNCIDEYKSAKSELKKLVEDSVQHRLISDVSFGTLLSGGIDSSLVTAVAQSVSNERIKTFSIGFKESKFNEAHHAREVASFLNTDHYPFYVSQDEAKALIESIVESYDEPFADSSALPTMLVSKLARQHVTMTLSGDGGDELFHGYGSYIWAKRLNNPLVKALRKPTKLFLSQLPNKYKRAARLFDYENENTKKSHIFSQEQYFFTRSEIQQLLLTKHHSSIELEENNTFERRLSPAEKQAIFDLKYYLKDDLLVKVDRASMKYSLENRVPLLDHRIVEFALNLHPKLKTYGGIQKYLLKELLYDYVPPTYFDRPKWGFAIPLVEWLKTDLKFLIDKHLNKTAIEKTGIFNYHYIAQLEEEYLNKNKNFLYNRIWQIIILQLFFEKLEK